MTKTVKALTACCVMVLLFTALSLTETAGGWQWQGDGNDHGSTRRLLPHWYTFEAHF